MVWHRGHPAAPLPRLVSHAPLRAAGLICLCVLATGCATKRSVDSLRREVERLQQENFQLRKDLVEARVRLGGRDPGSPPPPIDPAPSIPAGGASAVRQPATAPLDHTGERARVIQSEPITDASRFTTGPLSQSSGPGRSPAARLMEQARTALEAGRQAEAVAAFQEMVTRFPDDALADDAQLGLGEAYFQSGEHARAIAEYRRLTERYPFGDQVPAAFLKIAFCHLAMGERGLALDSFRTLSEAYPGTEAATVARQQIAHLQATSK